MSATEEFCEQVEKFLARLRHAQRCSGGFEDTDSPTEIDIVMVIQQEVAIHGLLDKAPVAPPQLREITSQIRALPLVAKVLADHPNYGDPDYYAYIRDVPVLECRLAEMLEYLHPAQPSEESERKKHAQEKASCPARAGKHAPTYSRADDDRYRRISDQEIRAYTNAELWTRHRATEKKLRPGLTAQAFRISLNRIRARHKLPTSKELQKK